MTAEIQPDYKMSLDDVIKKRLQEERNGDLRTLMNKRRGFYGRRRFGNSNRDNRRRIRVENLNKEIQNPELVKLFEKYGNLTRCGIKFDKLGVSTGIADIEFKTHEECEKAIKTLDNADISGEKIRVKYAASSFKYSRRGRSAGLQRRNLRRFNRSNRIRMRSRSRRMGRRRTRVGLMRRNNYRSKRRFFARTLGRKRRQEKNTN